MRLGVLMTGTGAHAAACAGVMEALFARQAEPYAVCGMGAAAWPAALYLAGYDGARMRMAVQQIARRGSRLMAPSVSARSLLYKGKRALCSGARLQRLLCAQAGERVMALCKRQGVFLCRTAKGHHTVVFSTKGYPQEGGAIVTLQASVSFAARAAMALPPFLAPLDWMGAPLLPQDDAALACRQLLALGAQRVLVISPQPSPRRELDALELAARRRTELSEEMFGSYAAVLRVPLPEHAGALNLSALPDCYEAGRRAAQAGLDRAFEQMGVSFCRVLPFRRGGEITCPQW